MVQKNVWHIIESELVLNKLNTELLQMAIIYAVYGIWKCETALTAFNFVSDV